MLAVFLNSAAYTLAEAQEVETTPLLVAVVAVVLLQVLEVLILVPQQH